MFVIKKVVYFYLSSSLHTFSQILLRESLHNEYKNDFYSRKYPRFANNFFLFDGSENIGRMASNTKKNDSKRFDRASLSLLITLARYLMKVVFQLMQPFKLGQPWFPERLLLLCSLLLSLILNGIITSQLASSFSKRMYYEDINTLEQLEKSGSYFTSRLLFFLFFFLSPLCVEFLFLLI